MRIQTLFHVHKISFTQHEKVNFSIYDNDDERPDVFDYLHRSIELNTMPYYNEQIKKIDMNLLKNNLFNKTRVYDKELEGIEIANFRKFAPNRYCGATLVNHPQYLKQMKDAGIQRVIDLAGIDGYKQACEYAGLEYYAVPELGNDIDVWAHPAFAEKDFYIREAYLRSLSDARIKLSPEEAYKKLSYEYEGRITKFKKEFKEFINTMKLGNLYMGCSYGTNRTSNALKLDSYFNAEANHFNKDETPVMESMKRFYFRLSPQDKKELGFTHEFENGLREKLGIKKDGI